MRVATFGSTTEWAGKAINFDDNKFYLEGHGQISASDVLRYDREGHLVWAYDGLREWVQQFSVHEARSQSVAKVPKPPAGAKKESKPAKKTSPSWWSRRSTLQKTGLIVAAVFVGLLVLSAIGSALDPSSQNTNATSVATESLASPAADTSTQSDTTPPTTYADYPEGWTQGPVTVELSAEDDSCSPDQCTIYYSLDGGDSWKEGTSVTIKKQGKQRLMVRAEDASGNRGDPGYCALKIDNRGPVTKTLNSPNVQKGKSVTLKYRIADTTPRVTAYIRLTGPVNKTIKLGSEPTGVQRTLSLKANLPTGTYKWVVYAKDLAGNKATQLAAGQLVVEPKPAPQPEVNSEPMVGITESGECYHTLSCHYWTQDPDGNSTVTVSEAQAMGFRPCSVCNPPQ